jgi:hypothetical protein
MRIACLGWGSLVWDTQTLPVITPWNEDGPLLPVEFARKSCRERVTLVLTPRAKPIQTLWALLNVADMQTAREALRQREGTVPRNIGYWPNADRTQSEVSSLIGSWSEQRSLHGVVWTALPPKWNGTDGVVPSIEEVVEYLRGLGDRSAAELYVRNTPHQVRTAYRGRIEAELGWRPS